VNAHLGQLHDRCRMFGRKFCVEMSIFSNSRNKRCVSASCERTDSSASESLFAAALANSIKRFAAAAQFVALLDFVFLVGDEVCRINFSDLMTKEIELLFARVSAVLSAVVRPPAVL